MPVPPEQAEIAAFLAALAGGAGPPVVPIETHISAVFVGAETVFKLKKAVRLAYLDFTDQAHRRALCEAELALNRRTAPAIYLGVSAVTRAADGRLALDGPGAPVEWVVRMRRIPGEAFLDGMAAAGALTPGLMDALADRVAAFHASIPPASRRDPADLMAQVIRNNVVAFRASAILPEADVAALTKASEARLAAIAPRLRERAAEGRVRRGHGDLHLGNICLWEGEPTPFDALEFDEDLATIDVGYDLAFLLMDLDIRATRALANRVLNRYHARLPDTGLLAALPLWLSLRAAIRAHVTATQAKTERPPRMVAAAGRYLAAARAYLAPPPPVLVAVGGLPGTGKTTLARALAPMLGAAPGALLLRSDEIRKRLAGVPPETRLARGHYTKDASQQVYAALLAEAERALGAGHAVIADAVFSDPAERAAVRALAARLGVPFQGLWLEAPVPELERRLGARIGDASDADAAVLRGFRGRSVGAIDWVRLDAGGSPPVAAARAALAALAPRSVSD